MATIGQFISAYYAVQSREMWRSATKYHNRVLEQLDQAAGPLPLIGSSKQKDSNLKGFQVQDAAHT